MAKFNGLTLVGEGHHGKVYKLDSRHCVKVYRKKEFLQLECKVLQHSERFPFFPRVHECKENYMVREYFEGPNLWEYLSQNRLNENIMRQLLEILDSFVKLGYSKLDCHLHHIIVTDGECLKIIDPTTNMTRKSAYPRKLLEQLKTLGLRDTFLIYTREHRPDFYAKWKNV